ncbi:DUF6457 domain-containing protein, partial [Micromonospora purpureochromogenes]|uniref:DUF6457 domain-containing protein n=1 Tax=Micromonospora purpureochromogenes TaxID=47872 RepID=UPI0033195326
MTIGPRLDDWLAEVSSALDLDAPPPEDTRAVLEVVRQVAHGVCRPAAPLAAYLIGAAGADRERADHGQGA